MKISRRKMIQATAAGVASAAALPLVKLPVAAPKPKFFTPAEFALVDEMSDMIIPTDEQSAGARAAGVKNFGFGAGMGGLTNGSAAAPAMPAAVTWIILRREIFIGSPA